MLEGHQTRTVTPSPRKQWADNNPPLKQTSSAWQHNRRGWTGAYTILSRDILIIRHSMQVHNREGRNTSLLHTILSRDILTILHSYYPPFHASSQQRRPKHKLIITYYPVQGHSHYPPLHASTCEEVATWISTWYSHDGKYKQLMTNTNQWQQSAL